MKTATIATISIAVAESCERRHCTCIPTETLHIADDEHLVVRVAHDSHCQAMESSLDPDRAGGTYIQHDGPRHRGDQ